MADQVAIKSMEQIEKQDIIFNKVEIKYKDEKSFNPKMYFQVYKDGIGTINGNMKYILFEIFEVSKLSDLLEQVQGNWTIIFTEGNKYHSINRKNKTVTIYKELAEEVVKSNKRKSDIRKIANSFYKNNGEKKISSLDIIKAVEFARDLTKNFKMTDRHKQEFIKMIPEMIKNGEIKLKQEDISEMNKKQIDEIVDLGYDILNRKRGTEKKLGIKFDQIHKEIAWQKYFEKYGDYLLFGSTNITEKVEKEIKADHRLTQRKKDSFYDIITLNRYGFLDIVELKKSDFNLFRYDKSHDTVYPNPDLSKAISQLINYLMIMPSAYSKDKEITLENGATEKVRNPLKGTESAKGLLIIGNSDAMLSKSDFDKVLEERKIGEIELKLQLKLYLRELNYSMSHIEIVTYDELLSNLKNFSEKLKVEITNTEY